MLVSKMQTGCKCKRVAFLKEVNMAGKNYSTVSHTKIMDYFTNNQDKMVTVAELDRYLRQDGIEVNSSTIYRYLNKLSKDGTIMKYVANKGEMSSFQYVGNEIHNCKEHLHLRCVKCDGIIHLECGFMDEISSHIMRHHGFSLICESSVLFGICEECRKAQ